MLDDVSAGERRNKQGKNRADIRQVHTRAVP